MSTKIVELKYDLGNAFYKYLALDVIRKLNMTTNIKTLPLIPVEIIEGRRVNYTQDLTYNATENIDDIPPTRKSARITRPVVRALHQDTWEE